jgi:hypothetical protein
MKMRTNQQHRQQDDPRSIREIESGPFLPAGCLRSQEDYAERVRSAFVMCAVGSIRRGTYDDRSIITISGFRILQARMITYWIGKSPISRFSRHRPGARRRRAHSGNNQNRVGRNREMKNSPAR